MEYVDRVEKGLLFFRHPLISPAPYVYREYRRESQ